MNMANDIQAILAIARAAGEEILKVYRSDFDFETKGDGSPLTIADQRAHQLIEARLQELTPEIPVLSEESVEEVGKQRLEWSRYWLVDPLDGTREFIKKNGEFTVNIALIEDQRPCAGVVYAPVLEVMYFAEEGRGAWKQEGNAPAERIRTRPLDRGRVEVVASRSHMSAEVGEFVKALELAGTEVQLLSMGSSLKLCLVAEGSADVYPRLGPTSEWDTAAAHCVVEAAGGQVLDCDLRPLRYSKPNILNPWFMVIADPNAGFGCRGFVA